MVYYRWCMINVAHPPVANTTATEPSDQVARLAVGGSQHLASAVALLFSGGGGGVGSFRGRGQCGLADRSLVVDAPSPCRAHRRMHDFAVSTRSASGEGTACARS